jgi:hypothetical protein
MVLDNNASFWIGLGLKEFKGKRFKLRTGIHNFHWQQAL